MSSAQHMCVDLEEWQNLQDPKSRRRIQNRIAQRVYRRKRKAQRDALKRNAKAGSASAAAVNTSKSLEPRRDSRQRSESECSLPSLSDSLSSSPYDSLSSKFYPQLFHEVDQYAVDAWASSSTIPTSPPLTAQLPPVDQCIGPLSLYHDPSIKYPVCMSPDLLSLSMDQTLSIHSFHDLCDASPPQENYFPSAPNSISSSSLADSAAFERVKELTALQTAASAGHGLAVNVLLNAGANVEDCTITGSTALHLAASSGHADTVNLLLDLGADIYARDFEGRTALHFAAQHDHGETIMYLVYRGVHIDTIDHYGTTALHLAAERGLYNTVRLLIESGANVSARDFSGRNPLLRAAGRGHASTVKLLLHGGADTHANAGCP